jgi:DNA invertase Pin-like site-specific DNA recombinase
VQVNGFDGPVNFDLTTNIRAVIAEEEKAQIGRRVRQSLAGRARAGIKPTGTAPIGYRWVEDERENKVLAVDPKRAKLVERIFTDYVNGGTQRGIAHALNAEGIPSPARTGGS